VEKSKSSVASNLLALEADLGEPLVYRATGQILAAGGLPGVPLQSWGLVGLTATRVIFRHFPQSHPLFGGKDAEVTFEVPRSLFTDCQPRVAPWWARIFSATPDHVALTGPGVWLNLDLADDLRRLPGAWAGSP